MTIVAKFPAGSATGTYTPAFEEKDFIAGGVKVSNAFGTRNVQVGSVTVKPGATVSGTVNDSSGKAVSGAAVELYKDGTKVADATAGTDGKYTISNVSTGTYTLKAKSSDGSLNGSASVTVAADSISNADVTLQKWQKGDVNKDGEINVTDIVALINHVNGTASLTGIDHCDLDGNSQINVTDVVILINHVNGSAPMS